MNLFIENLWNDPETFFIMLLVVVFSICCHEFCHAYIALREGDDTAAAAGHLTLNPLCQMGLWSLILFCMVGLAWGQVPVNYRRMYRGAKGAVYTALAGPLCNFLLAVGFALGLAVCVSLQAPAVGQKIFFYGSVMNFVLGFFNLLPLPGLDGWAVVYFLIPAVRRLAGKEIFTGAMLVLALLLFAGGFEYLYMAAQWCTMMILTGVHLFFSLIFPGG